MVLLDLPALYRQIGDPVSSGVWSSFGLARLLSRLLCPVEVNGYVLIPRAFNGFEL